MIVKPLRQRKNSFTKRPRKPLRIPTELSAGQEAEEKSIHEAVLECSTTKAVMLQRMLPGGLKGVRCYGIIREKELKTLDSPVMWRLPERGFYLFVFFLKKCHPSNFVIQTRNWQRLPEKRGNGTWGSLLKWVGILASISVSITLQSNTSHRKAELSMSVALTTRFQILDFIEVFGIVIQCRHAN